MSPESSPLVASARVQMFGQIALALACGVLGYVISASLASQTEAFATPPTRSVAMTRSTGLAKQGATNYQGSRSSSDLKMASVEGADSAATEDVIVEAAPLDTKVIGMMAVASALFGGLVMKMWNKADSSPVAIAPADMNMSPAGGARPIAFRTTAPWMGSSADSYESRGSRLVLQAAKGGKGKGGGAKGKVAGIIKLALPAGKATPAPPVGPALGQYGLNIVAFCKEYNAATEKDAADGMIIPVEITAFEDRSYTFVLKTPPASVLLRKAAGVPKGSATPNKDKVGSISLAQLEEIARVKLPDLNTTDVQKAMKIVEGTAKNMGITINA